MKIRQLTLITLAGAMVLALSACSSSRMLQAWKDPAWEGPPIKKVLLIGVAANETNRRVFEDKFRSELAKEKIDAISSYTVLPASGQLQQADIELKLKDLGVDGVVVSRVTDQKQVETYYPPTTTYVGGSPYWPSYYGGYYPYYSAAYGVYSSPGYTEVINYIYIETNLYDARTGKLVWTGLTETEATPGGDYNTIDDVVMTLIGEVREAKAKQKK